MLKRALPILVFVLLLGFLAIGLNRDPRYVPSPLVDKPAPAFVLAELNDASRNIALSDWRGQAVILNVWGSWCIACSQEHGFLMSLSGQPDFVLLGLNWKDELPAARRWLRERGDPYLATAFDADGRAGIDFGVYGAPETFLIDPDQVIRHKHVGPLTKEIWQQDFVPRLAQYSNRK